MNYFYLKSFVFALDISDKEDVIRLAMSSSGFQGISALVFIECTEARI